MASSQQPQITALLSDMQQGVPGAVDRLAQAVMSELHVIAERAMQNERDGHTLQPTELVDEAFMRLLGRTRGTWLNRAQFFSVAAKTIRLILVDHARQRRAVKRDHGVRVTLDENVAEQSQRAIDLVALDDALARLDAVAPRQARVVELRYFGGLDIDETAAALNMSASSVKRDWNFARAYLLRSLDVASP